MKTVSEISDTNFVLDHFSQTDRWNFGSQRCTLIPSCTSARRKAWPLQAHIFLFWDQSTFHLIISPRRCWLNIELKIRTGELEGSTASFDEQNIADLVKSGPIRFSAVDAEFKHLVTVGEDKKLKVWELDGPKLRSQRFALASAFVRIPSIDLHAMHQGPSKTTDLVRTHEERPNNSRL